jgi:hypothetical protein
MAYAIMRTAKLKSIGAISSCEKHNERQRETLNADKQLLNLNKIIIGNSNISYVESFKEITKNIKIRKNAVYGIECFMSASPDAEFWRNSKLLKQWADETTPHIHAFIIPIHEGKLNCKKYLGGRNKLRALQTTYHNVVKKYGLERGIEGSKAKHQDVKRYYTALNQELTRELPKPKMFESKEKYKLKVDEEYRKVVLKNLSQKYQIEKLQNQLCLKKKYKNPIPKRKSIVAMAVEEYDKKDDKDKELLKFLNKNPEIKSQLQNIMKSQHKDKEIER